MQSSCTSTCVYGTKVKYYHKDWLWCRINFCNLIFVTLNSVLLFEKMVLQNVSNEYARWEWSSLPKWIGYFFSVLFTLNLFLHSYNFTLSKMSLAVAISGAGCLPLVGGGCIQISPSQTPSLARHPLSQMTQPPKPGTVPCQTATAVDTMHHKIASLMSWLWTVLNWIKLWCNIQIN